ncbi:MAG: uracil-DNA glycosylase, partial [Clostridia bacterium]
FFEALGSAEQKPLIFGDGQSENPVLMLIGEAPGEHETLQGKPFVGKAGKNLEAFLQTLHLKRGDIYISNVVKIRPTKVSAAGRVVNRPPSREEKALFTPWLMREIAVVQPGALVTLGNVALQVFLKQSIGAVHGQWNRAVIAPPEQAAFTLPLFALYHPASIIYNPALSTVYQDDLGTLGKSLGAQSNADDDI